MKKLIIFIAIVFTISCVSQGKSVTPITPDEEIKICSENAISFFTKDDYMKFVAKEVGVLLQDGNNYAYSVMKKNDASFFIMLSKAGFFPIETNKLASISEDNKSVLSNYKGTIEENNVITIVKKNSKLGYIEWFPIKGKYYIKSFFLPGMKVNIK